MSREELRIMSSSFISQQKSDLGNALELKLQYAVDRSTALCHVFRMGTENTVRRACQDWEAECGRLSPEHTGNRLALYGLTVSMAAQSHILRNRGDDWFVYELLIRAQNMLTSAMLSLDDMGREILYRCYFSNEFDLHLWRSLFSGVIAVARVVKAFEQHPRYEVRSMTPTVDSRYKIDLAVLSDQGLPLFIQVKSGQKTKFEALHCIPNYVEGDQEVIARRRFWLGASRFCRKFNIEGVPVFMTVSRGSDSPFSLSTSGLESVVSSLLRVGMGVRPQQYRRPT